MNADADQVLLFARGLVPAIDSVVSRAIGTVNRAVPRFGCRHVVQLGERSMFIDAQQPLLGLMCLRCARKALPRHDPVEERTCDVCGDVVELLHGMNAELEAVALELRDTGGHRRRVAGSVTLFGVGACRPCFALIQAAA